MKFKIQAGAEVETATPHEIGKMLDGNQQSWFAEMARGVKFFRFTITGTVASGALVLDDNQRPGPEQGFIWAVQRFACDGFTADDTGIINLYRDPATSNQFLGQLTAGAPMYHPGQLGVIVKGGEFLTATGATLEATDGTPIIITGEALEVPEFMAWKLL